MALIAIARASDLASRINRPAFVVHGPGGECLDANAVALDALGLTRAEFLARKVVDARWELFRSPGRALASQFSPPAIALRTGYAAHHRVGVRHLRSRAINWLDVRADPVDDSGRRIVYVQFDLIGEPTQCDEPR